MPLFNRSLLQRILADGYPISHASNRATGKTTGAILRALGESMRHPNVYILVDDPDLQTTAVRDHLVRRTRDMIADLRLQDIEVRVGPYLGEQSRPLPPYTPGVHAVYVLNSFCERV